MKTTIYLIFALVCQVSWPQSKFDPVAADQLRNLKEDIIDQVKKEIAPEASEASEASEHARIVELKHQNELLRQEIAALRKAEFERAVKDARVEAVRLYPDAGIAGSAFSKKMIEIADRLEAEGNELVYAADAPLRVAEMAAGELHIKPSE